MSSLDGWLAELARSRAPEERADRVLWPRTPIGDEIQERIRDRVGVSDAERDDRRSRTWRIGRLGERLVRIGAAPPGLTVLDIACGDGLVLLELKRRLPASECHGVDLHAGDFPAHAEVEAAGVRLHPVLLQDLFAAAPPRELDLVLMLNTFRAWDHADLHPDEADLPGRAEAWLREHARHVVITVRPRQLASWRDAGWRVYDLGRGEDDSRLVCLAPGRRNAGGWPATSRAVLRRLARR